MPNADTTLIELAEDAGLALATYIETRGHTVRGVRPPQPDQHIAGDTTTPPAPGAIQIGPLDA